MYNTRNKHGITLIEVLLGLILGGMLLNNLIEIYLAITKNQMLQMSLNKIQENIRITTQLFTTDIHKAGFLGCFRKSNSVDLINHTSLKITHKIAAFEAKEKKYNTDGISVWYADKLVSLVSQTMKNKNSIFVTKSNETTKNTIILITDCLSAEIIEIKNKESYENEEKIYLTRKLNKLYKKNSEIWLLNQSSYFVSDSGRKNSYGKPIYSLYEKNIDGKKIETIEGIDEMKINFYTDRNLTEYNIKSVSIKINILSTLGNQVKKQWYIYATPQNV